MNTELIKYPKTMHLPFSESLQNDDRRLNDDFCFNGKRVIVTVKLDGESTSMYKDAIHARSLYSMAHNSQHYIKGYHATIQHLIPEGWRVCGENMYARHSIEYNDLESFFYVFNIWDENNKALPWKEMVDFCELNGISHVPVLGVVDILGNNFDEIEGYYKQSVTAGQEGIVIHNIEGYTYEDFQNNVAKAVRRNHVATDVHWTKTWVPNKLKENYDTTKT